MKHLIWIFTFLGISFSAILGQNSRVESSPVDNQTFSKGEFLKFRVHYGMLTAGYATLEVSQKSVNKNGTSCYHIVGKGNTNSAFDTFYKCRDTYETFVAENSLLPVQFNRDIQEGGYLSYTEVRFDQDNKKAHYTDKKKRVSTYTVPDNIQDVISSFFYARTTNDHTQLQVGDRISLRNFIDRKTFGLEAELLARETIKVEGEKYKALKFKLLVDEAGLVTDGSKISFWISDDHNKVPLRIKSDLVIGSIKADLVEAKGLTHPFDSRF